MAEQITEELVYVTGLHDTPPWMNTNSLFSISVMSLESSGVRRAIQVYCSAQPRTGGKIDTVEQLAARLFNYLVVRNQDLPVPVLEMKPEQLLKALQGRVFSLRHSATLPARLVPCDPDEMHSLKVR